MTLRREGARYRHAGAHGGVEAALVEHDPLARGEVGRDGAKWDGEFIEGGAGHRRPDSSTPPVPTPNRCDAGAAAAQDEAGLGAPGVCRLGSGRPTEGSAEKADEEGHRDEQRSRMLQGYYECEHKALVVSFMSIFTLQCLQESNRCCRMYPLG